MNPNVEVPDRIKELLKKYSLTLNSEVANGRVTFNGKGLIWESSEKSGPTILLNFDSDLQDWASQLKSVKTNLLVRALKGQDSVKGLRVLDGTLGFAKDAIMLVSHGCQVTGVERDAIPCLLVEEAIQRSTFFKQFAQESLLTVVNKSLDSYCVDNSEEFDALYLDPIFPRSSKKTKPKKEMFFLQSRPQEIGGLPTLESAFSNLSVQRVVVKRPLKGDALFGTPSYQLEGKVIRFDVYTRGTWQTG